MSRRVLFFVWQAVNEKPPCVTQILALADMGTEVAVLTRNCSDEVMQEFRKRNIPVEYIRAKKCRNHLIQKAENYLNYRRRFRDFFRKYRTDDSILWVGSEQGVIRMWPFIRNIHPMVLDALEFYEEDWYQKGMRKIAPQVEDGKFSGKEAGTFVLYTVIAHAVSWIVVAPVLDIVIYGESAKLVFAQGAIAFVTDAITAAVVGLLLLKAYSATKVSKGSLAKNK